MIFVGAKECSNSVQMKDLVKRKVDHIHDIVMNKYLSDKNNTSVGLYSGCFGALLFLYYYSKYYGNDKSLCLLDICTDKMLNYIAGGNCTYTFCDGFAGVLYLFEHLKENDLLDVDIDDRPLVEGFLINSIKKDFNNGLYDFMHGGLGPAFYMLKKSNYVIVKKVINLLYDIAEKYSFVKVFKWKYLLEEGNIHKYNISLSHGMSSIIIFIIRVMRSYPDIEKEKCEEMLYGAINYIKSQEIDVNKYGSFFPYQSIKNSSELQSGSRLAWCYGDLGVAYSLWLAGNTLNDQALIDKALRILLYSTKRLTVNETQIVDSCICHGSSGVVMIFRHLYLKTGILEFYRAMNYWIEQTLGFATFPNGLSGFMTYSLNNYSCDYSLLTGISGVGLVFLSYLENDNQPWDELFLLS